MSFAEFADPDGNLRLLQEVRRNQEGPVMELVRGRVTARLDGDRAWAIIGRLSRKYTGQPYPLRTGRVVFLVEPEHAYG